MSVPDDFQGYESIISSSQRWAVITPAAGDLAKKPKALYFNSAGTVTVTGDDGVSAPFKVAANQTLTCRPTKVTAWSGTAGDVIGLY